MHDLEGLGRELVAHPPAAPSPIDALAARARRHHARRRAFVTATTIVVVLALTTAVVVRSERGGAHRRTPAGQSRRATRTLVSEVPVGEALGVAADEHDVWVTGVDVVRRIDPHRNAVVATVAVPGSSDIRSVSIGAGSVWVTDTGTQRVTRIDPATNRVVASIAVPGSPTGTAAAAGAVWVALPNPNTPGISFVPVDPATNRVGPPVVNESGGPDPFPTMASDGARITVRWADRAWILDPNAHRLLRIDPPLLHGVRAATVGGLVIDRRGRVVRLARGRVKRIGATVPGGFDVVDGGRWGWVLARRSARVAPTLQLIDTARLRTVGRPVRLPSFPADIAPQGHTAWVATAGALTRVDVGTRPTRPDLCPSPEPLEYLGAGALRPLTSATTDPSVAARALSSQRARLRHDYPNATAYTVGPGYGRAWTRERGAVVVRSVDDVAILAHFPGPAACPRTSTRSLPVGGATPGDVPVLLAADGPGAPGVSAMHVLHPRRPGALAVDPTDHLVMCDDHRILRRLDDGTFERIAGTGHAGFSPDGTPALDADLDCNHLAAGPDGTLSFTEGLLVRAVTPQGRIRTVAGNGSLLGAETNPPPPTPALATAIPDPAGLTVAPDGRLWISGDAGIQYLDELGLVHVWRVGASLNLVIDGAPVLFSPGSIAVDTDGSVWVFNFSPKLLVHFSADGRVLGHWDMYLAQMIADPNGGLIVADHGAFAVEHIGRDGTVTTLVPSNPGPGLRAFRPASVARTRDGTLYATSAEIADPPQDGLLVRTAAGVTRIR